MAILTPILGLIKDAVGVSFGWGATINDNLDKLDQIIGAEHKPDGTHKAIVADSISVIGDITVGGSSLSTELANAAQAKNDRIAAAAAAAAADADRIAAEAAWSAALAANPDLNPSFRMNPSTITADITIPAGFNAQSVGPLTVGEGINITVADTANWSIV